MSISRRIWLLGPAYHLGAGRFDSDLSLGDFRLGDPATELVGASGTAAATTAVPDGQDESASELNRKAPSGDVWTVPVGLGVSKVVKLGRLPVKLQLSLQYMPVHPHNSGQEWNVQVQVTPVLPKLIKDILFE